METQQSFSDYERERGKPMPSKLHSVVQTNLTVALADFRPEYLTLSEVTLDLDGRSVTPDLSLFSDLEIHFTHDETRLSQRPLLSIEIASPTQGVQSLIEKIHFLLDAGVSSCWLVQPHLRTVTVFTPDKKQKTYSEGVVEDPELDVRVELEEIFQVP